MDPRCLLRAATVLAAGLLAFPLSTSAFETFADEDRSAELTTEPDHQQYQLSTPTTVTYDRDTITQGSASQARVYVAEVGRHRIRVLDLDGRVIGQLDDSDQALASDSPHCSVPEIRAPLGIYFLSASEADDDRLAGLYVNDAGTHRIHFFRTLANDPDAFEYVTSFGTPGSGGGEELYLPRNLAVTPQGFLYVADEFNHRVKGFQVDPDNGYQATLVDTEGWQDAQGDHVGAGPIIRGVDKNYGVDSTHYDDYAGEPAKRDGFRIPQGMAYYRDEAGATYLYVADNGNNRIKVYQVDTQTGALTVHDMLGRFENDDGESDHLKRPRGVRTDADGNLYVADTYNGRLVRFPNVADSGDPHPVAYRADGTSDAKATWVYGRLGIHQVEMRTAGTAATEDAAFQLPNDLVPVMLADGSIYREDIWAWGSYFSDARVHLVSDTGNHRIKKCWSSADGDTLLRCSVSEGVGGVSEHEFWGYPRTLDGQLHAVSGMAYLESSDRLLVSDTPNTRINTYDANGQFQGRFPGTNISYGVTGIDVFTDAGFGEGVAVLVASDATLPWPYTGDSSLRVYDASGSLEDIFNLTYRTGSSAPEISFAGGNYPVDVSVRTRDCCPEEHAVYVTSFGEYTWRFDYDTSGWGTSLSKVWSAGGPDSNKGDDRGEDWKLGPRFFDEGAVGTFHQIGNVLALDDRVYVSDRNNQRIQALDPDTGLPLGQAGEGGGIYDYRHGLESHQFFLPVGLAFDESRDALIVGDSFNMVARALDNPDGVAADGDGVIRPNELGYWLDPEKGTRPGGLFAAEQVASGDDSVFVYSLISNRITRFEWSELAQ